MDVLFGTLDISVRADDEDQCYYAWADEYPDVPACKGRTAPLAVGHWLDDLETALQSGEVEINDRYPY